MSSLRKTALAQVSKYMTVAIFFTSCAGFQRKDQGHTPTQQISAPPSPLGLPQITSDNSTKCGDISTSRSSNLDMNLCEARAEISSVGIDVFLTTQSAATQGAKGIFISLYSYNDGVAGLKDGAVYQLISQRAKDGRLIVPDHAKSFAAAAYGDGPMTNQPLDGSLSFIKVPRKTGDSYEVVFNFVSLDGKKSLAGKATGVVIDSPLMKPDKN